MTEATTNTVEVLSSRLTATLLNDHNFQSWVRAAILSLNERDLYDNVTGDAKEPEKNKPEHKKWRKTDLKAMNSILNSIQPSISDLFIYHNTAKEMWDAINNHFSKKKNHAHIYHLKKEIHQITQNHRPIINYITELKRRWEELNLYLVKTTDPQIIKEREQERVYQFLAGLDESFEPVRAQILLAAELPSLDDTMALLQGEESRRLVMAGTSAVQERPENHAMAALRANPSSQAKGGNGKKICEHCRKEGHEKNKCWFLNPELRSKWWKDNGGSDRWSNPKGEKKRQFVGAAVSHGPEEKRCEEKKPGLESGSANGSGLGSNGSGSVGITRSEMEAFFSKLSGLMRPNSGFSKA